MDINPTFAPLNKRKPVIFGFTDAVIVASFFILVVVQLSDSVGNVGIGWHLKTGAMICAQRLIPHVDPFLHSDAIRPWVSDQWLSDVLLHLGYQIGGWRLLAGVLIFLFLILLLIIRDVVERVYGSPFVAVFSALIAFKLTHVHFILRPTVFGFIFFAILYRELYLLQMALSGSPSDARKAWKRIFWVVPCLFLLWANMHPSFVTGFMIIGLFILSWVLERVVGLKESLSNALDDRSVLRLIFLGICCAAVTLINPNGIDLHRNIYELATSNFFMNYHQEWLPLGMKSTEGELWMLSVAIIVIPFFIRRIFDGRWGWGETLLFSFFSMYALRVVRMLPYFGIASSVPFAIAVGVWSRFCLDIRSAPGFGKFHALITRIDERERRSSRGKVGVLILIVFCLVGPVFGSSDLFFSEIKGFSPKDFPVEAFGQLKTHTATGGRAVVAAPARWGGYITWKGDGVILPLIDDRNSVAGESFTKEYDKHFRVASGWREYFGSLGASYLMLPTDHEIVRSFGAEEDARVLHRDETAVLIRL